MLQLNLKPTHSLLRQLAQLERTIGRWESLASSTPEGQTQQLSLASMSDIVALDSTLSYLNNEKQLADSSPNNFCSVLLEQLGDYFSHRPDFKLSNTVELHQRLLSISVASTELGVFRQGTKPFMAPPKHSRVENLVFQTVSPFVIETRLNDLFEWLALEQRKPTLHPLLTASVLQLAFLQTSPFTVGNHLLALLLTTRYAVANGYSAMLAAETLGYFKQNEDSYFAALRQAERSMFQTWSTFNVWAEFLIEAFSSTLEQRLRQLEAQLDSRRLTSVQKRIVEVIRISGMATRDQIAQQTGINASTVKYNLSVLTDRGQLRRVGAGRTTSYGVQAIN